MYSEPINWTPGVTLREIELQTVRFAYGYYKNNKSTTARALGISVRSLDTKLEDIKLMEKRAEWIVQERARENKIFLHRARGEKVPEELLKPIPKPFDDKPNEANEAPALSLPKRRPPQASSDDQQIAVGT